MQGDWGARAGRWHNQPTGHEAEPVVGLDKLLGPLPTLSFSPQSNATSGADPRTLSPTTSVLRPRRGGWNPNLCRSFMCCWSMVSSASSMASRDGACALYCSYRKFRASCTSSNEASGSRPSSLEAGGRERQGAGVVAAGSLCHEPWVAAGSAPPQGGAPRSWGAGTDQ